MMGVSTIGLNNIITAIANTTITRFDVLILNTFMIIMIMAIGVRLKWNKEEMINQMYPVLRAWTNSLYAPKIVK